MKRTYLAKRNALLAEARFSWGLAALVFALLVALMRFVFPGALVTALEPAFALSSAAGSAAHTLLAPFVDAAAVSMRNDVLAEQNRSLAAENQALADKLSALTALAGGEKTIAVGIVAGVVARPPESPYDTLIVGAGTADGVAPAMEAFGDGGIPLGVVTAVTQNAARVTLFSAPGATVAGWVGKAKLPLTLTGAGAGAFSATVPRSAAIAAGDIVYLPGPGALPAGSITRIDSNPSSPAETLRIQPAANLFTITWVELRDAGRAAADAMSMATTTRL